MRHGMDTKTSGERAGHECWKRNLNLVPSHAEVSGLSTLKSLGHHCVLRLAHFNLRYYDQHCQAIVHWFLPKGKKISNGAIPRPSVSRLWDPLEIRTILVSGNLTF